MKKSKSFILFITSLTIFLADWALSVYLIRNQIKTNGFPVVLMTLIAAGTSFVGFILGVLERNKTRKVYRWIGIIGNLLLITFFIAVVIRGTMMFINGEV